jgi:Condensation domain
MAVVSRSRRHNIKVTLHDVLRASSLIALAGSVDSGSVHVLAHDEKLDQGFGLSPIQQLYFLATKGHQGSSRFNQSFTLRLSRHISSQAVKSALQNIVSRHSMLRARFKSGANGEWEQLISSVSNILRLLNVESHVAPRTSTLPSDSGISISLHSTKPPKLSGTLRET